MQLSTPHYLLRKFTQADLDNVFKGLSDPRVILYYGVSFETIEETQTQIDWFVDIEENQTGRWRAIESRDQKQFLGAIGFNSWSQEHQKAEIGFWLLPDYWGKGIIREALPTMIEFGFSEMKLHRIEAEVETQNLVCKKVLNAMKFKLEGTKRDCEIKNGQFISLDLYSLLKTDC